MHSGWFVRRFLGLAGWVLVILSQGVMTFAMLGFALFTLSFDLGGFILDLALSDEGRAVRVYPYPGMTEDAVLDRCGTPLTITTITGVEASHVAKVFEYWWGERPYVVYFDSNGRVITTRYMPTRLGVTPLPPLFVVVLPAVLLGLACIVGLWEAPMKVKQAAVVRMLFSGFGTYFYFGLIALLPVSAFITGLSVIPFFTGLSVIPFFSGWLYFTSIRILWRHAVTRAQFTPPGN